MVNNGVNRVHRNVGTALSVNMAFLTYLLTHSMEHSPSLEANGFSPTQEFSSILWNEKFYYSVYKCRPPVPILSHFSPINASQSHFLKIHLSNMLPSTPGPFPQVSHQNPVRISPLPPHLLHAPPI